ncbi:MAG: hypothetical protein ACP5GW_02110, partial [Caldisericaceae bacterium]
MKRILSISLISLILLLFVAPMTVMASQYGDVPWLTGLVVSNISLQDFTSINQNVPVGLVKAPSIMDLVNDEEIANLHSVQEFAPINLFIYSITSSKEMSEDDLVSYFESISPTDLQEYERTRSAILSLYKKNGRAVEYALPSEPEVNITYKVESTKSGYIQIPERHIVKTNKITTYFLLDPSKVINGERLSCFDLAKTYDIEPCFFDTLVQRNKLSNNTLDFAGFYIDIPNSKIDDTYKKILSESLEKLASYLHSKGKLLIVENLTKDTIEMGKYADIIGISYNYDNLGLLQEARISFPKKQIFMTFDGNFTTRKRLEELLNYCTLYGIYPEFRRDLKTGEFLYYEDFLNQNAGLITSTTNLIKQLNQAGFNGLANSQEAIITKFGSANFSFYCIKGSGDITLKPANDFVYFANNQFRAINSTGTLLKISQEGSDFEVTDKVNDFDFVRIAPIAFSPTNLGVFKEPSNSTSMETIFVNTGIASGKENIELKTQFSSNPVELTLGQFEEKIIVLDQLPVTVSFDNISFTVNRQNEISYDWIFFAFLVLAMLLVILNKNVHINNKISNSGFYILVILSSILIILLNRAYIHYSTTTVTYLLFAALFLIYSFKTDHPQNSLLAMIFNIFIGYLYNFVEFGSLRPLFYSGFPPIQSFEQFLLYFPFIFCMMFFFTDGNKRITKTELLAIFSAISSIVFFFDSSSIPFLGQVTYRALIPFIVIIAFVILLAIVNRSLNLKLASLLALSLAVILISIPLSNIYYGQTKYISAIMLSIKEAYVFASPLLF